MGTNLKIALKALTHNRLQAALTLCGMSMGVAMVVIVSGLGLGAQQTIESQIEASGPTQILVRSGNFRPAAIVDSGDQDSGGGEVSEGSVAIGLNNGGDNEAAAAARASLRPRKPREMKNRSPAAPLGDAELRVLRDEVKNVRAVAAGMEGNVSLDVDADVPVRVVHVQGFEVAYPDMRSWHLASGRWISSEEHAGGAPVALLTAVDAARLWPGVADPLGKVIRVGGQTVRVVGVLAPKSGGEAGPYTVVPTLQIPLVLARTLLGRKTFDSITLRTKSVGVTSSVAADIKSKLRIVRGLPDDTLEDFRVDTQSVSAMPAMGLDPRLARAVHSNVAGFEQTAWEEMARSLRQSGRTFTLLLAAAATVSLVVGGIGVMNVMLVSVSARTREIGLRMAVGARTTDVMTQFLVEAVTLAALGGLVGLVLGSLGLLVAKHGLHWATAISPTMLLLAVAMAALTGVAFGYGPARRASVLDPVIALRAE
jgi:putative ABC transport system permease protein